MSASNAERSAPSGKLQGTSPSGSLEAVFLRSRSAARRLFAEYALPLEAAASLLDGKLPALESPRGILPGSSSRLLEALEDGCRRYRDRQPSPLSDHPPESVYDVVLTRIAGSLHQRTLWREEQAASALPASQKLEAHLDAGGDPVEYEWSRAECSSALAERLLDLSRESWSANRERAEGLAKAALTALSVLEPSGAVGLTAESPGLIQDLSARAWSFLGNIRRLGADFRSADQAFAAARACLARGSLHPLERAHALVLEAGLRRDQRRYPEALQLLQQAAAIFRWAGDRHCEGGTYQRMATVQQYAGRPNLAIPLIERALGLIDGENHPRNLASVTQNFAVLLCEVDRFSAAREILPRVQSLFAEHGKSEYDQLTVLWLEARILCGEGRTGPALALLESLRERYLALERPFDAALVSLELVAEYLGQGKAQRARELAAQALPMLQSLEIERETLAALVALRRATEMETATADWVRSVIQRLRIPAPGATQAPARPS